MKNGIRIAAILLVVMAALAFAIFRADAGTDGGADSLPPIADRLLEASPTPTPTPSGPPGRAHTITIDAVPPTIKCDGVDSTVIDVFVTDADGRPVADGTFVEITITGEGYGSLNGAVGPTTDGHIGTTAKFLADFPDVPSFTMGAIVSRLRGFEDVLCDTGDPCTTPHPMSPPCDQTATATATATPTPTATPTGSPVPTVCAHPMSPPSVSPPCATETPDSPSPPPCEWPYSPPVECDSGQDSDNDGLTDAQESFLQTDPFDPDTDGDTCSDGEEFGDNPTIGGDRDWHNPWDFFDVTGDGTIDLADTLDVLTYFGDPGFTAEANLRDRSVPDPVKPWRTAESDDGVDLNDALASLASFGHGCAALNGG